MIPVTWWSYDQVQRERAALREAERKAALHAKAVARRRKAKRGGKR